MSDRVAIPLSGKHGKGLVAYVSPEDAERVLAHRWHGAKFSRMVYAKTNVRGASALLHRFIMQAPPGTIVDHEDRDPLNCIRANLRFATCRQNVANRRPTRGLRYKGITKRKGRWTATIAICLGTYDTPEEAARAYDAKAKELHGEFAYLNFPDTELEQTDGKLA